VLKTKKISFETELKRTPTIGFVNQAAQPSHEETSILSHLPQILCYPSNEALAIELKVSRKIYIDRTRIIEVELQTGRNTIERGQLTLRAASAGLRLMPADATVVQKDVRFTKGKAPGVLELSGLAANSTIIILVPYDLESNLPQITIGLDFTYNTPLGTFQYLSNQTVVTDLALDVSVHDLFRADLLYSRFQIRASRGIPLLVSSIDLAESDRYAVEAPPYKLTNMLVLPRQDGTILYKIKPRESSKTERQSMKEEKSLKLSVNYLPLNELVRAAVEQSLLTALEESNFESLRRFLRQALIQRFQYLSQEKLEEVALLKELHLPSYESLGWNGLLDGLAPDISQQLGTWLKKWHNQNQVLTISPLLDANEVDLHREIHSLKISVPLPRLHILHTAHLSLPTATSFVSQGSAIAATITVTYTRRWESPSAVASMTTSSADDTLEFFLEVDTPLDTWLIGGRRRTRFSASEDEEKTFELMLVPLKTGRILLPEVNVRLTGKAAEELRCETDYRSLGKAVMVIADITSTTIGLNEMAGGGEVVLMGSERRK
jgi:hypothetical protein